MKSDVIDTHIKKETRCHHDFQTTCSDCRLASICLPIALETEEVAQLDEIIQRGKPLRKGEHLYRVNDSFSSVYAVRSGTLKAYTITDDGKEQVTGFYFPGEIVGMDGISKNTHASSAKALETSAICEIPFERLEDLSIQIPSLQRHFFQLLSHEIAEDQQLITLLSKNTAEERIASLMLSISARYSRRKLSAINFRLPMSRTDIGNYLGLTVETVSRVFSRLQKQDILEVDNKEITILSPEGLRRMANAAAKNGVAAE